MPALVLLHKQKGQKDGSGLQQQAASSENNPVPSLHLRCWLLRASINL